MSRNDLVNFKAFLRHGQDVEVRRFSVETDVVTSFVFLKEKLQSLFPVLRETEFKVTWRDNDYFLNDYLISIKDSDGDEITVTSDEELIIALTEMKEMKVIDVIVNPRRMDVDEEGETSGPRMVPQVVCDGCESVITGIRYKCAQCPDFDLCIKCESQGMHPEHVMLRFSMNQYEIPRGTSKMIHNFFRTLRKSGKHHHKDKESRGKRGEGKRAPHGGCPFVATDDVPFEYLQQMARPYVDAFLQGVNSQTNDNANPNANYSEYIKNILKGIFGEPSAPQQPEKKQEDPKPETSAKEPEKPMEVDPQQKELTVVNGPDGWKFVRMTESSKSSEAGDNAPSAPTPENPAHPNPVIAEGLRQLREMGFSNHAVLTELLEKYEGNLAFVIRDLCNK